MSNCVVLSDYVSDNIYFWDKKESQNGSDSSTGHTEGKAKFKHVESEILLSDWIYMALCCEVKYSKAINRDGWRNLKCKYDIGRIIVTRLKRNTLEKACLIQEQNKSNQKSI